MERRRSPTTEKRWPVWIQFLLGTAGIAVTAAGLYELTRSTAPPPPNAANQEVERQIERDMHREMAAMQEAERLEAIARVKQRHAEAARQMSDLKRRGARCMGGVWILKEGNETRSAGRCGD